MNDVLQLLEGCDLAALRASVAKLKPMLASDTDFQGMTHAEQEATALLAARSIQAVFQYCFYEPRALRCGGEAVLLDEDGVRHVIQRFFAVAWLLRSEMLLSKNQKDGRSLPMTLRELAALPQVSCSRCNLSILAQKFGKLFNNFRGRTQKRESAKPHYAEAAKVGWEKRRAARKEQPIAAQDDDLGVSALPGV